MALTPERLEYLRKWREKKKQDPQYKTKRTDLTRSWRKNNPDKVAALNKRRRENGDNVRSNLKKKYGMSENDYAEMLDRQGNVCAICGEQDANGQRRLVVDHDHATGKVRGLLCNTCNLGIGYLKDNTSILTSAIEYLTKD